MKKPIEIYLSGGMHPREVNGKKVFWHDAVKEQMPPSEIIGYFDPRKNRPENNEELLPFNGFTSLDLWMAGRADIVFANLEVENPGGEGTVAEVFYHAGRNPQGLRIVVNQDPLDDRRTDDHGRVNRARYRRFINAAGNPHLPGTKTTEEFPYVAYLTLEEGINFLRRTLTPLCNIENQEKPILVSLVGSVAATYSNKRLIQYISETFRGYRNIKFLSPDFTVYTYAERQAMQNFYSYKADIIFAYAPSQKEVIRANNRDETLLSYASFFSGITAAKQSSSEKLVIICSPDKEVLDTTGDNRLNFTSLEEAIKFMRVAFKQFA